MKWNECKSTFNVVKNDYLRFDLFGPNLGDFDPLGVSFYVAVLATPLLRPYYTAKRTREIAEHKIHLLSPQKVSIFTFLYRKGISKRTTLDICPGFLVISKIKSKFL